MNYLKEKNSLRDVLSNALTLCGNALQHFSSKISAQEAYCLLAVICSLSVSSVMKGQSQLILHPFLIKPLGMTSVDACSICSIPDAYLNPDLNPELVTTHWDGFSVDDQRLYCLESCAA